jgi:hypothetical protein
MWSPNLRTDCGGGGGPLAIAWHRRRDILDSCKVNGYTLDRWWGFAHPKAAGSSHCGKVASHQKPSQIRLSLCPRSDDQVNYNVREQSASRPSSRYKYLLGTNSQTKNCYLSTCFQAFLKLPLYDKEASQHTKTQAIQRRLICRSVSRGQPNQLRTYQRIGAGEKRVVATSSFPEPFANCYASSRRSKHSNGPT